jgi:23S rRNA (guanosine2251-2'-O)-methyltransferase
VPNGSAGRVGEKIVRDFSFLTNAALQISVIGGVKMGMRGVPIQGETPYLIPGFHSVRESLQKPHVRIEEIWISEGRGSARTKEILRLAEKRGIPIRMKNRDVIASMLPNIAHQGIVALAEKFEYADFEKLAELSLENKDFALLIAADHITDEGNLGALIRAAAFFGAHGLVLPKKRSAAVSIKVLKRSSGAYVYLPIARVVNLNRALDQLKKNGYWIIGASEKSSGSIYEFDWRRDLVLILGNEQRGLSQSVQKRCDQIVKVPAFGYVTSLNLGVAGGVILSEICRQRHLRHG